MIVVLETTAPAPAGYHYVLAAGLRWMQARRLVDNADPDRGLQVWRAIDAPAAGSYWQPTAADRRMV